ncbi:integrase catalytic domain-containing protein [Trichonephila clavata]|uniref:Integrase catalytic domain-containing protein n=1 Tax=Trichonephila clavata TaxID=2740835 RepID=A0A8X6L0W2_TRICU|nr:integrase catalytic domain-containing protein [Trichonephila clavata]
MFKNCRKEDLRIVALELGETLSEKVTIVELTEIIKENKYFKEDVEFVKELIQYTIEDRKKAEEDRKKAEEDRKKAEEASTLEKEVASHISVRAGNDWFRPLELAKEIDLYNTSRGKCLKPVPNVFTRNNPVKSTSRVFLSEVKNSKCVCCAESHPLYKCAVYLKLPVTKRIDIIKANNLCFNCLSTSHRARDCKSRYACSNCQKRHHNTIHYTERARDQEVINSTLEPLNTSAPEFIPSAETQNNLLTATSINRKECVLLGSAICYIKCENGLFPVKAILDSGSTSNFVTKSLCDLIGLKKYKSNVLVSGLSK